MMRLPPDPTAHGRGGLPPRLSPVERWIIFFGLLAASVGLPFGFAVQIYSLTPEPLRPILFGWLEALS